MDFLPPFCQFEKFNSYKLLELTYKSYGSALSRWLPPLSGLHELVTSQGLEATVDQVTVDLKWMAGRV